MQKCRSDRTNEKNLGCGDALASHYVAETSGEFSEVGHGQQRPHSLAEDAVRRQPVSADRFPANREINRELFSCARTRSTIKGLGGQNLLTSPRLVNHGLFSSSGSLATAESASRA